MTGGKKPRRKGFGAEREIVNICKSHGISCKRSVASVYPDLKYGKEARPVSVKRRANGLQWVYDELNEPYPHDFVLFRSDRMPWLKISFWKP